MAMTTEKKALINIIYTLSDQQITELLKHAKNIKTEIILSNEDKKAIEEGLEEIKKGKFKSWEEIQKENIQ